MRLALLASLMTFAGSIGGFAVASGGDPVAPLTASPPAAATDVVRVGPDDCPGDAGRAVREI